MRTDQGLNATRVCAAGRRRARLRRGCTVMGTVAEASGGCARQVCGWRTGTTLPPGPEGKG